MTEKLTPQDIELIQDEEQRYQEAYHRILKEIQRKTIQLKDDQLLARELTSEVVATQREEEKQALQSDEYVAHGLASLRLRQSQSLSDLVEQPYFARVVYCENEKDVEFKLGLAGFPELRIIDWRQAPISRLYYDYQEGDEYDEEIAGRQRQGKIKLKRAYRGKEGVLSAIELQNVSYLKTQGQWHKRKKGERIVFSIKDKEKIKAWLSLHDASTYQQLESEEGYLKNVLSLLTPEQFEMICLEKDKPVIVQGAAGTGKTTVALHRLAWLIFEQNGALKEENSLVVVFNQSLAAYIKYVLPEMGIHHVKITTYFDWALDILHHSGCPQLIVRPEEPPSFIAAVKAHHNLLQKLQQFLTHQGTEKNPIEILFLFYSSLKLHELGNETNQTETKKYLDKQISEHFFDIFDLSLLLHITFSQKQSYTGKRYPGFLDYLIIDEAQDFSSNDLTAILHALGDKNHLILAGDLGQKILENRDFASWPELLKELDLVGIDVLNLNMAFRSTYQIYEMAEYIRDPHLQEEDLQFTPRFGSEPLLVICHGFSDAIGETKKWIEDIIKVNRHTIGAVICKTRQEARFVYDALIKSGTHGVRYGDTHHFDFTPGITITDVKQVKGLEFAHVLLFNPSEANYSDENLLDRNLLYVAVTRASHRVDLVCFDSPSKLIPEFIQRKDLTVLAEVPDDLVVFSNTDQDVEDDTEDRN